MANYLVTGCAGFIGCETAIGLLEREQMVVGIDNLNDYYDVSLKQDRLNRLHKFPNFSFYKGDIASEQFLQEVFNVHSFEKIIHLAAQAGVRYSLSRPDKYVQSNLVGFVNLLEAARQSDNLEHFVYASSSSVYGANTKQPFSEDQATNHPISLYASTKKANELIAHSYSHLFRIPTTGVRFFTIYGPWGRPDMALFKFTKAILGGQPIDIYHNGKMQRDFTYIADAVHALANIVERPATPNLEWLNDETPDPGSSTAPYRIYNIGNHQPIELMKLIEILEQALQVKAEKNFLPMQPGDVVSTYAGNDRLEKLITFKPNTPIELGIEQFVSWFRNYYRS